MDAQRFEELKKKRFEVGLTAQEAEELGKLFAEQEGEPYQSAEEYQAEQAAGAAAEERAEGGEMADRPETVKAMEEEGATPQSDVPLRERAPEADAPAGTRSPWGAKEEEAKAEE